MGKHALVTLLIFAAFGAFAILAGWASFGLAHVLGGQSLGYLAAGALLVGGVAIAMIWLGAAAANGRNGDEP